MAANIGLNEGMVRASKTVLNNLLSDHFVLLAKTWNYHWNVKGVSFHSYHVFMEDLYNGLIEDIDAIAERIRSLDERPIGSLAGYLEHNRIKDKICRFAGHFIHYFGVGRERSQGSCCECINDHVHP